ncbi:metal-dependent hydrolase family protein [Ruegeria atlantica]|uniref:Putative chlorohydrolase/aminohydrolase n=1 Tax=Ruegeria atlantica TaxID=81569 RepID=A0A0P1EA87_9RHOB|nr:amidohydrolase family protein [Ruegeria atlantica]CUH46226.1 putative chlorohydrolase/aminohydrolase [Ruegeria atlantica]
MKLRIRTIIGSITALSLSCSLVFAQDEDFPTLFTNVNVFDGVNDQLIENANVLVVDNLIATVSAEPLVAANAQIIDGGGRTLMPGLIDMHVHLNMQFVGSGNDRAIQGAQLMTWEELGGLAYASAQEYLPAGVTTVRDLCGTSSGLQKHIDIGTLTGPRIYLSGACVSASSGHGDWRWNPNVLSGEKSYLEGLGLTTLADGGDAVLKASRNNLAGGADFVKMMSGGGVTSERDPLDSIQGTPEELAAMVKATGDFGTYSAVHAYTDISVQNAIRAGVVSIEHGNLMSEPETFKMVAEANAWVVPAMAAFAPDILEHPYYGNPALPAYAKTARVNKNGEAWIKLANEYRINMAFGSDSLAVTPPAWRQTRDFQITQWGRSFGNLRTLQAMTSDAGKLLALSGIMNPYPEGKIGVIEEGAYADIILVDGDPLEDLSVIGASESMFGSAPRPTSSVDTIPFVMKDGVIFKNTLN